jgi:hypothetical protein
MRPYKEINRFGSEAVHHTGSNPVLTTKTDLAPRDPFRIFTSWK